MRLALLIMLLFLQGCGAFGFVQFVLAWGWRREDGTLPTWIPWVALAFACFAVVFRYSATHDWVMS